MPLIPETIFNHINDFKYVFTLSKYFEKSNKTTNIFK